MVKQKISLKTINSPDAPLLHMGDGAEVDVGELEEMARRCRVDIVKMTHAAKSGHPGGCLLYTSPSPRDATLSRMPSSA